jgi:hypothetical protein
MTLVDACKGITKINHLTVCDYPNVLKLREAFTVNEEGLPPHTFSSLSPGQMHLSKDFLQI